MQVLKKSFLFTLFILTLSIPLVEAQDPVTITISLPLFYHDTLADSIAGFQEANPDIVVSIVDTETPDYSPNDDIEAYLDNMQEYIQSADVLVGTSVFTPLTTRAGYFLDLNPLVSADNSIDVGGFFGPMWASFQWEGGLWAIPLAGDVVGMLYDPKDFDSKGLRYPDERWSFDDLRIAAEQLVEYDPEGNPLESPILSLSESGLLILSMIDAPLYNPLDLEIVPAFDNPQLESVLDSWNELQDDGLVGVPDAGLNLTSVAFAQSVLAVVAGFVDSDTEYQYSTLPGGRVALAPLGGGISSGTQYPDQAYRLIKFLTEDAEAYSGMVGQPVPARRELFGTEQGVGLFSLQIPEALQDTIMNNAEIAIPYSSLLFSDYVTAATNLAAAGETDARGALDEYEVKLLDDLKAASERKGTDVAVNIAQATVVAEGQIDLKFGVVSFGFQIANRDKWDTAIADLVASRPDVGNVTLQRITPMTGSLELADLVEDVDCFYQPSKLDTSDDMTLLLPLDPLIATDPNLSVNDFVGGALTALQFNNQTYGMPLHLQPEVLFYNEDIFNSSGAYLPYQGWTVADFEQALRAIRFDSSDPAPYASRSFGGTHILTLIVAYGGLPMDFRTRPALLDFTSEQNVNAIRQVLDLAKDGYIDYQKLGGGISFTGFGGAEDNPAIYAQVLSELFNFGNNDADANASYKLVTFPQGTQFGAVSYDVGGAYIASSTQYVEPCYEFISRLTQYPEIFGGMPTRRSVINSDAVRFSQGDDAVAFFTEMDDILQQPNVVQFPSLLNAQMGQAGDIVIAFWLYDAFDDYVLNDAILEDALADAEQFAVDYQSCIAEIPPYVPGNEEPMAYVTQFMQCSVNVDPETRSRFPGFDLD